MRTVNFDNIQDVSVEEFAHQMIIKKETYQSLTNKINKADLSEAIKETAMKRLRFAKERIEKPLDIDQTILFIIFPFGMINRLNQGVYFDAQKELEMGYLKKVKEFRTYSFLGIVFYVVLILMIALIL